MTYNGYTLADGAALCTLLAEPLRAVGLFVGLTGGCCYKLGARKDIDLVLYRHRQQSVPAANAVDTFVVVVSQVANITDVKTFGFVTKMKINGAPVDVLFPEAVDGGYPA